MKPNTSSIWVLVTPPHIDERVCMGVFPKKTPKNYAVGSQHHLVSLESLVVIADQGDIVELGLPLQLAVRPRERSLLFGPKKQK